MQVHLLFNIIQISSLPINSQIIKSAFITFHATKSVYPPDDALIKPNISSVFKLFLLKTLPTKRVSVK